MTCPFCQHRFEAATRGRCPECGCEVMRLTSGLVKTSAVLIAYDDKHSVYRSVQEVPEPLRQRLVESTQGINSATIVIADPGGREHMEKSMERIGQDAAAASPAAELPEMVTESEPPPVLAERVSGRARSRLRLAGIGMGASLLAGLAAWLLRGVQW